MELNLKENLDKVKQLAKDNLAEIAIVGGVVTVMLFGGYSIVSALNSKVDISKANLTINGFTLDKICIDGVEYIGRVGYSSPQNNFLTPHYDDDGDLFLCENEDDR